MMKFDTIAAIATPYGMGGIGVVRLSGDLALSTANRLFRPKNRRTKRSELRSHRIYHGKMVDPVDESMLDEVLLFIMRAPKSYTREDVVEIHCHGGVAVVQRVLETVLTQGIRLAEPGEFTRRAFLNGRIDLSQAEAVMTMVQSPSSFGAAMVAPQLWGALNIKITAIEKDLTALLARIETAIDFIEDENDHVVNANQLNPVFQGILAPLENLLKDYNRYHVYREGILVVIAGKPNVGKSSLLNALLQSDRAIVTPIPGTTRDLIEEKVVINGIPVRLVDTAGLHPTGDEVEALGVAKAEDLIAKADLVLFMIDGHHGVDDRDRAVYGQLRKKPFILVRNKYDLYADTVAVPTPDEWTYAPIIDISATEAIGLEQLSAAIVAKVVEDRPLSPNESPLVPNLRQKGHIRQAVAAINTARKEFKTDGRLELVAESVKTARNHLTQIGGQEAGDTVLDEIFGQFCIGK